jgi:hypothetical protein
MYAKEQAERMDGSAYGADIFSVAP